MWNGSDFRLSIRRRIEYREIRLRFSMKMDIGVVTLSSVTICERFERRAIEFDDILVDSLAEQLQ